MKICACTVVRVCPVGLGYAKFTYIEAHADKAYLNMSSNITYNELVVKLRINGSKSASANTFYEKSSTVWEFQYLQKHLSFKHTRLPTWYEITISESEKLARKEKLMSWLL